MTNKRFSETKIALKWKIPVTLLRQLKDKCGECLTSDSFDASNISGVKYYALIYPNGDVEERRGTTSIFLFLVFPAEMQIEADVKISIESANCCVGIKGVFYTNTGKGKTCCTTDELFDPENGFIVDGALTIKFDGMVMTNKTTTKEEISDDWCVKLWSQEETKDFAFFAQGKQIRNKLEAQLIATMDSSNVSLLTNCALLTNARKLEKRCAEFLDECLHDRKPIADLDLLDKEFALNLMKNAFYPVSFCWTKF